LPIALKKERESGLHSHPESLCRDLLEAVLTKKLLEIPPQKAFESFQAKDDTGTTQQK
jgi:hypothetical protein